MDDMALLIMIKMFNQAFKINNKYNNYIVSTYVQNYYTFYGYKCGKCSYFYT